jgi:hypothetical protein
MNVLCICKLMYNELLERTRNHTYAEHSSRDTKSIDIINTLQFHEQIPCKMAERASLFDSSSILNQFFFVMVTTGTVKHKPSATHPLT